MMIFCLLLGMSEAFVRRPYDRMPKEYHLQRFRESNAWIQKMSAEEWAFFTQGQRDAQFETFS